MGVVSKDNVNEQPILKIVGRNTLNAISLSNMKNCYLDSIELCCVNFTESRLQFPKMTNLLEQAYFSFKLRE